MPQSDGINRLERVAIEVRSEDYGNQLYRFKVNPESYKISFPQRSTAFKTRSSNVVEDFGQGVPTIEISGTTGFNRDAMGSMGVHRMNALQRTLDMYAQTSGFNTEEGNTSNAEMFFYNYTDDYSYRVHLAPDGYSITRSVDKPLLFQYAITLFVISDADEPQFRDEGSATIGNPNRNTYNYNRNNGVDSGEYKTSSELINPHDVETDIRQSSKALTSQVTQAEETNKQGTFNPQGTTNNQSSVADSFMSIPSMRTYNSLLYGGYERINRDTR